MALNNYGYKATYFKIVLMGDFKQLSRSLRKQILVKQLEMFLVENLTIF
jgi:hypothetical protein